MQAPARYLVVLDTGGASTALMFTADRLQVAEFDASTEEVVVMTTGLQPTVGAAGPDWDRALAGQSLEDRAAAKVFVLDI